MSEGATPGVRRGCGLRKEGGLYAECGLSKYGRPLEDFIICPPAPLDFKRLGVEPLGVRLLEIGGATHVIDWVGSRHYKYVTDFLEEVGQFGLSRRLSKSLDVSRLNEDSRMVMVHARVLIVNPEPLRRERIGGMKMGKRWDDCPRGKSHPHNEACVGLCWEDVEDADGMAIKQYTRIGVRTMPSFQYLAARYPKRGIVYRPAAFASFPLSRLVVVKAKDGTHEKTFNRVRQATSLPVDIVDN